MVASTSAFIFGFVLNQRFHHQNVLFRQFDLVALRSQQKLVCTCDFNVSWADVDLER